MITFFTKSSYSYLIKNLKEFFRFLKLKGRRIKFLYLILQELAKIKIILKKQPITIYYDFACSPLTYGDLSYVIFMCKYFANNFPNKVNLYLVYGNYEDDYFDLKKNNAFAKKLLITAKQISKNDFSVYLIKSDDFFKNLKENIDNYILFKRRIKKRLSINKLCFNMLNIIGLCKKNIIPILQKNDYEEYLPDNFSNLEYITFSLRYNKYWGENRNLTFKELDTFIKILNNLKTNKIVLVSDEQGKEFYKSILKSKINNQELIIAGDFSQSFIEDLAIVLNSNLHIQPKGSGLLGYLHFSEIDYIVTSFRNYELNLGKNNVCSWASNNQVCCNTKSFNHFIKELNKYLIKNNFIKT